MMEQCPAVVKDTVAEDEVVKDTVVKDTDTHACRGCAKQACRSAEQDDASHTARRLDARIANNAQASCSDRAAVALRQPDLEALRVRV